MAEAGLIQFDEWVDLYAERVETMRTSAVRDLFAAASRSDIISLSGGMPDVRRLPLDTVGEVAAHAILQEGIAGLQYGESPGRTQTKEVICRLMKDFDVLITPEDVTVTTGAQQALDLLAKTFINPGDAIITEGPTYLGALQAFSAYQPTIHTIAFDDDGMRTDLLEKCLATLGPRKAKFIYTIPTFQNPGGVTMSLKRRTRLLELAHAYQVPVIEDDPYGRLRFEGEPVSCLRALDEEVIYLGTVSKVFAPGLRTGWVIAPHPILQKLNMVKQGSDLCGSALCQVIVEHYFNETPWRDVLSDMCGKYRERRDAMLAALDEFFPPEAHWTHPTGGFFVWVTLPPYVDTTQMLSIALEAGVTFVPGDGCYPAASGKGHNAMRIAFCYEEPEKLREAVQRLSLVIEERLELYRAFINAGMLRPERLSEEGI
ncbi:MAG: PLP-dependent aminotransferase family protein [Coriobacteriales bacterium]|jgi:2-aminoadipate transaminase|nr:PLP-dependent aminotransferase family protein [Coriobacteriales bacterium]